MEKFQTILYFVARLCLVIYFLKAGMQNLLNPKPVLGLLGARKFPFPKLVFAGVVSVQILGSLALLFNFYMQYAVIALISFTILANLLFCTFWNKTGWESKMTEFLFFANLSVIGGLLLILVQAGRFF
jgi:putative oxidoreductase